MVSLPISSPTKITSISYADRAKNAQNLKSPISIDLIATQSVPSSNVSSETASSFPYPLPRSNPNSTNIDAIPNFVSPTHSTALIGLLVSPTTDASGAMTTNNKLHTINNVDSKALSTMTPSSTTQKSPLANIWEIRKEQLAATRTALTDVMHQQSENVPLSDQPNLPQSKVSVPSESIRHSIPNPSRLTTSNNVPMPPPVEYDPFVVHVFTKPFRGQIPIPSAPVDTSDSSSEASKPASATVAHSDPTISNGLYIPRPSIRIPLSSVNKSEGWFPDEKSAPRVASTSHGTLSTPSVPVFPLSTDDSDSWPEVGKSAKVTPLPSTNIFERNPMAGEAAEGSNGPGGKRIPPKVSKKSEKVKWVPIPLQELRSINDAPIKMGKRKAGRAPQHPAPSLPSIQPPTQQGATMKLDSVKTRSQIQSTSQSASQSRIPSPSGGLQFPHTIQSTDDNDPVASTSGYAGSSGGRPPGIGSPRLRVQTYLQPQPQRPFYVENPILNLNPPSVRIDHIQNRPPLLPTYPLGPYATQSYENQNSDHNRLYSGSGNHSPTCIHHTQRDTELSNKSSYSEQPPPTNRMLPAGGLKPLPPEQSQPVSGYLVPRIENSSVVFGSTGIPGASWCPSPSSNPINCQRTDEERDMPFTSFSIGVNPQDVRPSMGRPRTVSNKGKTKTLSRSKLKVGLISGEGSIIGEEPRIIDLTNPQASKWEFGTATALLKDAIAPVKPNLSSSDLSHVENETSQIRGFNPSPPVLGSNSGFRPLQSQEALLQSSNPLLLMSRPSSMSPPRSPPGGRILRSALPDEAVDDEFEVKDFGYGFGPVSGTGFAESITREERARRERERIMERERERLEREKISRFDREMLARELMGNEWRELLNIEIEPEKTMKDAMNVARPKRGGHYERNNGGSGRRGRGTNGFERGFNRRSGGLQHSTFRQHQRHPSFMVTPPHLQPLMSTGERLTGYYSNLPAYPATSFETYPPLPHLNTSIPLLPPFPVPMSQLSFPLDSKRWYLLGQLEYYLSSQNMARDFFLRENMDSRGWISISLISSFNRIRQLTADERLVLDVLALSTVVEVRGEWVRMREWEKFVLPDAPNSIVERLSPEYKETQDQFQHEKVGYVSPGADIKVPAVDAEYSSKVNGNGEVEDEDVGDEEYSDDEDVVFIMNSEESVPETRPPEGRS